MSRGRGFRPDPVPVCLSTNRDQRGSGVGDDPCRLGRKHDQRLFVFARELLARFLPGKVDVADRLTPMSDRRCQKGLHRRVVFREAERPGVDRDIPEPQWFLNPLHPIEELEPLGQVLQQLDLFGSHAGGNESP